MTRHLQATLLVSSALIFGCRTETGNGSANSGKSSILTDTLAEPHDIMLFLDLSTSMVADEQRVQRDRVHEFLSHIPVDWRITCYRISDDLFPEPLFPATVCDSRPIRLAEDYMIKDYRKFMADSLMTQLEPYLQFKKTPSIDAGKQVQVRPSCLTGALSALVQKPVESYTKHTYVVFFTDMLEECELAGVGAVNVNRESQGEAYLEELAGRVESRYPNQGNLAERLPSSNLVFVVTSNSINPGRGILSDGLWKFWGKVLARFGYGSDVHALMVGSGRDAAYRLWPRK